MNFEYCKIEIFIPEANFKELQNALIEIDAGHIGKYDACLSYSHVIGTWRPLEGTKPYIGEKNKISEEKELKVEVTCKTEKIDETIKAIKKVHPYEEPVINVIPLLKVGI